jgi:NAD(P)-dependent dehydrogenase (short-subunit alcohol dehydrogenase family)
MSIRYPDVSGRVALVTGAASGIGRSTALLLAERGAHLIVCDRDEPRLREVEAEIGRRSRCVLAKKVDVASREEVSRFADEVHALVPAVDVLMNNAGVGLSGGLLHTPLEDWEWVLGVNLWGVIHGCHFFVPKMVARGRGGYVVNVASAYGYYGGREVAGYVTSKFAVFGLTESLREELRPHGIGVSVICPGVIATDIMRTGRMRSRNTVSGHDLRAATLTQDEAMRERAIRAWQTRGYSPDRVAAAILRAMARGRGVVPVTPEAWALYVMTRLHAPLAHRVGALLEKVSRVRA